MTMPSWIRKEREVSVRVLSQSAEDSGLKKGTVNVIGYLHEVDDLAILCVEVSSEEAIDVNSVYVCISG